MAKFPVGIHVQVDLPSSLHYGKVGQILYYSSPEGHTCLVMLQGGRSIWFWEGELISGHMELAFVPDEEDGNAESNPDSDAGTYPIEWRGECAVRSGG